MILSHKHKFIFIHIGKTGGTSVADTLCQLVNMSMDDTRYSKEVVDEIVDCTPTWAIKRDHTGRGKL